MTIGVIIPLARIKILGVTVFPRIWNILGLAIVVFAAHIIGIASVQLTNLLLILIIVVALAVELLEWDYVGDGFGD